MLLKVILLAGAEREPVERFNFALAVVLTPPVVLLETMRLLKAARASAAAGTPIHLSGSIGMSLLGAVFSLLAGLLALKWLSSWLESGRWHWFGAYCLVASAVVLFLRVRGF